MRKSTVLVISLFLGLGIIAYIVSEDVSNVVKSHLRHVAKKELLRPIKEKIKKITSRSKVRLKLRRNRIKLRSARLL